MFHYCNLRLASECHLQNERIALNGRKRGNSIGVLFEVDPGNYEHTHARAQCSLCFPLGTCAEFTRTDNFWAELAWFWNIKSR